MSDVSDRFSAFKRVYLPAVDGPCFEVQEGPLDGVEQAGLRWSLSKAQAAFLRCWDHPLGGAGRKGFSIEVRFFGRRSRIGLSM